MPNAKCRAAGGKFNADALFGKAPEFRTQNSAIGIRPSAFSYSFPRQGDRLAARRRALPWVKVEKEYTFESPRGQVSFADLFEGRSQLVVYHFMFGPGWEEGCKSCSYVSDHLAAAVVHLRAKDVSFAAVSLAPLTELAPFHP